MFIHSLFTTMFDQMFHLLFFKVIYTYSLSLHFSFSVTIISMIFFYDFLFLNCFLNPFAHSTMHPFLISHLHHFHPHHSFHYIFLKVSKASSVFVVGSSRIFIALKEIMSKPLYYTFPVTTLLEYANLIWKQLIPTLINMSHEERLRKLNLPTLTYRRDEIWFKHIRYWEEYIIVFVKSCSKCRMILVQEDIYISRFKNRLRINKKICILFFTNSSLTFFQDDQTTLRYFFSPIPLHHITWFS